MRIFLTGATGHVGGAVLDALLRAGHEVTALVRNGDRAGEIAARGVRPVLGDLGDVESYAAAADAHDGYIHAGFDQSPARCADVDRLAVQTLLAAARRPRTASATAPARRWFIYTSTLSVLGRVPDAVAENAPVNPIPLVAWRPGHEELVLNANSDSLRTIVIRSGVVYGGASGAVADLLTAASNGLIRVVGDGGNRWPLVYDHDLADLYAKLAAHDEASGIYHANDEADERVNDIVAAIADHLPSRPDVRHVPLDEARVRLGHQAEALSLDQVVRGPRARTIGWAPTLRSVSGSVARLLDEWRQRNANLVS
ncbi:MAG: NAD-dependent epimerase/dehydratase family protein [Vicinamibacterales bacterium]